MTGKAADGKINYQKNPSWWPKDVPFAGITKTMQKVELVKAANAGFKFFKEQGTMEYVSQMSDDIVLLTTFGSVYTTV